MNAHHALVCMKRTAKDIIRYCELIEEYEDLAKYEQKLTIANIQLNEASVLLYETKADLIP